MTIVHKFAAWFTPVRRQRIQAAVPAVVALLVAVGYVSQPDADQLLIAATIILQAGAGILSLVHLRGGDLWAAMRGVVYTAAAGLAPVMTYFGFVSESAAATGLQLLSLALTALSATVSIFVSKDQEAVS